MNKILENLVAHKAIVAQVVGALVGAGLGAFIASRIPETTVIEATLEDVDPSAE